MKATFTGSQKEFDEFYKRLRRQQPNDNDQVVFMFEVDPASEIVQNVDQISFNDDSFDDENLDESDIFHSNNREWLLAKLAEADEDIKAGRVVPGCEVRADDIIARGMARLKERNQ